MDMRDRHTQRFQTEPLGFLSYGGEMAERMREFNWAASPLGPPQYWPQSLRSLVALILNSEFAMFLAWGPSLTFLYNDRYSEIIGDKHPRALGRPMRESWPEISAEIGPLIEKALAGHASFSKNLPYKLQRNGAEEDAFFTFSYSPVRDENEQIAGVFCVTQETTEEITATRRLIEERDRLAQLFEQAPTFMALLSGPEHRIDIVNPGYLQLVGHRAVLGKTMAEALPEAVEQGYLTLLNDVYTSGKAFSGTAAKYAMQATAGGPVLQRYVDFVYQPIKNAAGVVTGIFVEGADVTERQLADETLRESEAQLRMLNDNLAREVLERSAVGGRFWQTSPDLLGVLKSDGYFESANPAWLNVLGWSEEQVKSQSIFELLHPDDVEATRGGFEHLKRGNPILRFENRYRSKSGDYQWFAWAAAPFGDAYYCSGRNITAQKDAEASLAEAQEALRQSQKMEAIGQLTGGIAHDFNNLLAGISGSLELLTTRLAQGRHADVDRYITAARGAAKRAAVLTQRLLAFARRQTLDAKPTDINRLIADMDELVRRTVGPLIRIESVRAVGLWQILVDANQFENALLNLCVNARDAMPEGGALMIETANRWLDDRSSKERELPPGQYVSMCVSDTGTGMTAEVSARAFDPFFTTKPTGMGTGLGLSMIYGFARQSGGQARIYSEIGKGTMVCLYFPRYLGEAEAHELPEDVQSAAGRGHGETVLVVDDEPTVRMIVLDVLQELGYRAIEVSDGKAALKVLESAERIDLLISDVGLPGGLNGRQVADAARLLRPQLKVLFITGYAENAVLSHGHLEQGMYVLTKPFAVESLASRLEDLLKGSRTE